MLAGDRGEGAALAARLVVRAAEALNAERLIPITRAHVDSCLYHGEATIDFVRRLVDGGASVVVPTTLNVGTLDLLHPELWHGSREVAERGRLLMEAYRVPGLPADLHLRALPAGRCATGLRRAGGVGRVERHRLLQRGDRRSYGTLRRLHRYRLRSDGPRAGRRAASRRGAAGDPGAAHRHGRAGATSLVRRSLSPAGNRARAARREPSGGNHRPAGPPTRGAAQGAGRRRRFVWLGGDVSRGRLDARGAHASDCAGGPGAGGSRRRRTGRAARARATC